MAAAPNIDVSPNSVTELPATCTCTYRPDSPGSRQSGKGGATSIGHEAPVAERFARTEQSLDGFDELAGKGAGRLR